MSDLVQRLRYRQLYPSFVPSLGALLLLQSNQNTSNKLRSLETRKNIVRIPQITSYRILHHRLPYQCRSEIKWDGAGVGCQPSNSREANCGIDYQLLNGPFTSIISATAIDRYKQLMHISSGRSSVRGCSNLCLFFRVCSQRMVISLLQEQHLTGVNKKGFRHRELNPGSIGSVSCFINLKAINASHYTMAEEMDPRVIPFRMKEGVARTHYIRCRFDRTEVATTSIVSSIQIRYSYVEQFALACRSGSDEMIDDVTDAR